MPGRLEMPDTPLAYLLFLTFRADDEEAQGKHNPGEADKDVNCLCQCCPRAENMLNSVIPCQANQAPVERAHDGNNANNFA